MKYLKGQYKMKNTAELLKDFVVDNFLFGNDEGLENNTSFLEEGIIDSTGVLELVGFIEEQFEIQVDDEEMVPENLDSIVNLSTFIHSKIKNSAAA